MAKDREGPVLSFEEGAADGVDAPATCEVATGRSQKPCGECGQDAQSTERVVDLPELMGAARRMFIMHDDRRYVLRITKQNKLILTRDESHRGER